jgi:hypothetical protein
VGVADDVVPGIQLLWCSIVGRVQVGEMARIECLIDILIWNVVFAWIASKLFGVMNFDEGMLIDGAITPIGAVLQEPPLIC